jgi:hypothetical protein
MLLAVDPAPSLGETESELKQARRQAAHRERRILYNNDGDDITGWSSVTPAEYLSRRMAHLADTQVDSLFWCPGVTTVLTIPSQFAETYDNVISDHFKPTQVPGIVRDNVRRFMEAGRDPLAMTVDFCRRHDMEIFLTHRMNDVHDAHVCPWMLSKWKRDHPEYLFGREGDNNRFGADNRLPMELSKGASTQAYLPVGEDVVANAPAGKTAKCTLRLRLRLRRLASGDQVTVKLNGKALGAAAPTEPLAAEPATHWVGLASDPALVKSGDNLVEVRLATERALTDPLVIDQQIDYTTSYQSVENALPRRQQMSVYQCPSDSTAGRVAALTGYGFTEYMSRSNYVLCFGPYHMFPCGVTDPQNYIYFSRPIFLVSCENSHSSGK